MMVTPMIVRFRGKRYRLSEGLTLFIRGFQKGAGIMLAVFFGLFLIWAFFMAATMYVLR